MDYIKIRNFGPISGLDIPLRKLNVFIGEQGVGKSTLAKLLSCCRDFVLYFKIVSHESREEVMSIFRMYGIEGYFRDDTYIEYSEDNAFHLRYKDGDFSLSHARVKPDNLNKLIVSLLASGISEAYNVLGMHAENMDTDMIERILKEKIALVYSNLRTSFYCPAERGVVGILSNALANILLSNIPLPRPLIEYMSFFEKARLEYKPFKIPFLNLSYSFDKGENLVTVNGASVELEYASSGIQSVLPLLMVIDYCMQNEFFSSFTIEEPELNLFPTNQLHLIQTLIAKTNSESSKLGSWTITTHSPYLLSAFNISLLAGRIAERFPDASTTLAEIIDPALIIRPDEIAVYELTSGTDSCCRSIIDENTGLIKSNYLDSVSDVISADFNRLYKMYVKLVKTTK